MANSILSFKVVTDYTAELVSLSDAKAWCRITDTSEDVLIVSIIKAATRRLERYTGRSFGEKSLQVIVNNSKGNIRLPYAPIVSIDNVYDSNGVELTSINSLGGDDAYLVEPVADYLKINYTAGYTVLPVELKDAIKAQVLYMWNHRGDEKEFGGLSPMAKALAFPYKIKGE
jgi:hypothetical protein